MERPSQIYHILIMFLVSRLLVGECHNEDSSVPSKLSQQLHDLRMANFPQMHSYAVDNHVPNGLCKTWIGTVVSANSSWEEDHCRTCVCDPVLGTVCTQPLCEMDSRPYVEANCEEWSADDCCCLRTSCLHEGVRYAANDWFLLISSDPCTVCKCDPSEGLPQCLETTCPPVECVNATLVPGECCPLCPAGRNCGLPPLALPEGDPVTDPSPITDSASRIVTLLNDTSLTWNCTCHEAGSDAQCVLLET